MQLLELEIAKEMKRICEKNNIKYFLLWGSLLGAVRHEGFIPWDDDMDFGMLREDYEKFIDVCKKELDPKFFLQTWDTDPDFPFAYAKLRLKGTHFRELFSDNCLSNDGIFIDIFPQDNVPNSEILRKIRYLEYFICQRLLWIKKGLGRSIKEESAEKRVKYAIFHSISLILPYKWIKYYYKHVLVKYNNIETDMIMSSIVDKELNRNIYPRKWAEHLEEAKFEASSFLAFKRKRDYLTLTYGDYMTLPPIEERQGHLPMEIDFGEYNECLINSTERATK